MGRLELGVKNAGNLNLREKAAEITLRIVRQKGHVYVELRKVAKRSIFFCTLCLAECFSDAVLFDHLRGNLHSKRYNSAKATLLLPNPWPFNDGVLFFDASERFVGYERIRKCVGVEERFGISYVLANEEIANFELKIFGYGHVGAKICEDSARNCRFSRMWCAWLGDGNSDGCDELLASPKCDFAIVNIPYSYFVGKKCSFFEIGESGGGNKKRKRSFFDAEDGSEVELRKQDCSSSKRTCEICGQRMLFGKDVATLLNLKTGIFACSSRNISGAFHVFHVSCLIHWVLLCEFELWAKQAKNPRTTRGRKCKAPVDDDLISSIFCPDCLATGFHFEGDALEKITLPLNQTFNYKLKTIRAQKAWMRSPENLQKCSTGLCFPLKSTEKLQGKVNPAKLLLFYRAVE